MKILVTGFSSFPGVPVNPCEEVITWIAQNHSSTDVATGILPVSYTRSVLKLRQYVNLYSPNVLIHFGVSNRAMGLKLELMGYNARHAQIPDVDGMICSREVIDTSLNYDFAQVTNWKIDSMFEYLKTHCQMEIEKSNDPGRYVCNNLYWHSMKKHPRIPTLFVHIPPIHEHNRLSIIQAVEKMLVWTLTSYNE